MRRLVVLALAVGPIATAGQDAGKPKQESLEEMRAKVLARINHFRKIAGVDPVVEDAKLSAGCQKHAEYLRKNIDDPRIENAGAHREEKDLPGYSEEGAKSAGRSVVHWWKTEGQIDDGVDAFIATLYHRIPLLEPRLTRIGVGVLVAEWKVLVVDARSVDMKVAVKTHPVVYPAPDQKGIPLAFSRGLGEWPDPRPEPNLQGGYPITLQFAELGWQPSDVRVSLKQRERDVTIWLSTPAVPASKERSQWGVVAMIPKAPLEPSTTYTIAFECKQHGVERTPTWTKEWSFTTEAAKDKKPDRR
jgi:hypothetical protein